MEKIRGIVERKQKATRQEKDKIGSQKFFSFLRKENEKETKIGIKIHYLYPFINSSLL